jgi:preprotein translocase subunit Sec63
MTHLTTTTNHSYIVLSRKLGLMLAWIIFLVLAYRVSLIEIEHKEYDPFAVLNVDRVGYE